MTFPKCEKSCPPSLCKAAITISATPLPPGGSSGLILVKFESDLRLKFEVLRWLCHQWRSMYTIQIKDSEEIISNKRVAIPTLECTAYINYTKSAALSTLFEHMHLYSLILASVTWKSGRLGVHEKEVRSTRKHCKQNPQLSNSTDMHEQFQHFLGYGSEKSNL